MGLNQPSTLASRQNASSHNRPEANRGYSKESENGRKEEKELILFLESTKLLGFSISNSSLVRSIFKSIKDAVSDRKPTSTRDLDCRIPKTLCSVLFDGVASIGPKKKSPLFRNDSG